MRVAAGAAGNDLAARDADVGAQAVARLVEQGNHPFVDVERGANRAQGVIVVSDRRAEHRHDVVAHVFVDRTAIALDDRVDHLEITVQEGVRLFGAQFAGKFGIAGDVGKQHGNLATFAGQGGERGGFCRWFVFTL